MKRQEEGIPESILKRLDIHEKEETVSTDVTAIIESHQVKLPVPKKIWLELQLKKGHKCKVTYDSKTKKICYQL